ncbi:MAG: hypothetical protein HY974_02245 [Candidatus Kerfeldbacteria bacterium]|nr:hypothetical protein [Candidatus Kerfeldbacteria bacterium]
MEKKSLSGLSELELKQLYCASYTELEQIRLEVECVVKCLRVGPKKQEFLSLKSQAQILKSSYKKSVPKHQAICADLRQAGVSRSCIEQWRQECKSEIGVPNMRPRRLSQLPPLIPFTPKIQIINEIV